MVVAAAAALVAACSAHTPPPPIAGGWQSSNPSDDGAHAAALYAASQLRATLEEVEAVQRQVVAGLNYRLDLRLADGQRWRVTVWKRLDGTFALTDTEPLAH